MSDRAIQFKLLSADNKVVGYETYNKLVVNGWLYSKDGKSWISDFIEHYDKRQYVGLECKDGKYIYEGDIIKWKSWLFGEDNPSEFMGYIFWNHEDMRWCLHAQAKNGEHCDLVIDISTTIDNHKFELITVKEENTNDLD